MNEARVRIPEASGGDAKSRLVLKAAFGKALVAICLAAAGTAWDEDGLLLRFADGSGVRIWDDGQRCCERRYMTTDDDLATFVNAAFLGVEVRNVPNRPAACGEHQVAFLIVATSLGAFTVETHNEHTGDYEGFWLVASPLVPNGPEAQGRLER